MPVGSFIIATEPLERGADRFDHADTAHRDHHQNIGNYFRIAPDDRLIWGGRARFALSSPTSDLKSGRILQAGLRADLPAARRGAASIIAGAASIDLTAGSAAARGRA